VVVAPAVFFVFLPKIRWWFLLNFLVAPHPSAFGLKAMSVE